MSLENGVSVIVPVFGRGQALNELVERCIQTLADRYDPFEVILVDDGSPGEAWETIRDLASRTSCVRGIKLARNSGQHNASLAGIRDARYSLCVTMDDDLQNSPESMAVLIDSLEAWDLDVVYGVPQDPNKSLSRRIASSVTRRTLRYVLSVDVGIQVSSFRAFRTVVRDAFEGSLGPGVSLDALLSWATNSFGYVSVPHFPRDHGRSSYTALKLFGLAGDAITGYSTRPLRVASLVGIVAGIMGVASLLWTAGKPLLTGSSVPGFPFLASTIVTFSGLQLLFLGIIGEYMARMHSRIMAKPAYVVRERA